MENKSATNAPLHQHTDGVFDSKIMDESDKDHLGTASNEGSQIKQDDEPSPRQIHGIKWAIAYTSILSSTFLFALDNTVMADVQPSILNRFGAIEQLPWLGVAFALGGISILPWGKAYGIFNIKWLYISTVLLFEIGSALCAAAPTMNALIVGRVIGGVGGAGMYSGTLTYIAVTTSKFERPIYMAGVAIVWGAGTVLGPVVGGGFANSAATWRWAFYINLVIGAIFAPDYLFLLPSVDLKPDTSLMNKLKMMDWISLAIFFGGTTCFTMAVNFGGTVYAWNSGSEIALWVMTGVLLIAIIVTTIYHPGVTKENRMYPAHFLRRHVLVNLQLQLFLVSGVMLTTAYYIPLYFQFTKGDNAIQAAVRLLPFIFMIVTFSIVNGVLMPKFGYYMPWYVGGSALVVIGASLMYTINADTSASRIYGYTVLMGVGAGTFLASSFAVVQALVPVHDLSNAVGFMSVAQDLGIVVILAIAGTVYQNTAIKNITKAIPGTSRDDVFNIIAGTSSPAFTALPLDTQTEVVAQIVKAMSGVRALLIAGMALSFVLSLFLGREKLYMEGGTAPPEALDGEKA
ncbi:hypothetical protein HYALB_00012312 [Hymenoscyphus albidus]|uniref:Major facilitator superfamily (MFS) profile domain-containing protein n=1 Tax=Hymenoscyphus albidus TaxID=595503 RepID=A0A9N9Q603_9HELO|nr:hypothetical protein HYALB_00012312 [Hymenoscyphus albidus]